jgi:hypothetical protein
MDVSSLQIYMRDYWCIVSISWPAGGPQHVSCQLEIIAMDGEF